MSYYRAIKKNPSSRMEISISQIACATLSETDSAASVKVIEIASSR